MIQEEKARAYDEAIKKAKEIKEKIVYSHLSTESCKAVSEYIDTIIPELAESEDERIRKEIVTYLNFAESHNLLRAADYEKKKKWLAYLEKQKDAFENGRQFGIMQEQARQELEWTDEKQKEQKTPMLNDLDEEIERFFDECIQVHDAKVYGVDEQVISVDCYELTARHFAKWGERRKEQEHICDSTQYEEGFKTGLEIGLRKQKERKSVTNEGQQECPYKDLALVKNFFGKYKRKCKLSNKACDAKECEQWNELQSEFKNINEAFEDGKKQVVDNPERYGLCRPAEWGEEDEKHLNWVIEHFSQSGELYHDLIAWLKFLPERFNLQPKQEWSEEDEQLLGFVYDLLADSLWNSKYAMSRDECLDRLTSLRQRLQPRPSWKPSEEQMQYLLAVINDPNNAGAESCHLTLGSLYNDLKKLM